MKIVTLLLASLLSVAGAPVDNTFQTPDFNYPKDVDVRARVVLDSALRVGNDNLAVQSLAQISLAGSLVSLDQASATVALFDQVGNRGTLSPDYRSLLYCLEATFISSLPAGSDDNNADIQHWSFEKKQKLIKLLYQKAYDPLGNGDRSVLQKPIACYEGVLNLGNEWGRRCVPTLYDFVCEKMRNIYSYGAENDALRKEWRAFHANDADKLPLAYIASLKYRVDLGDYIYNTFGKGEELGLFLCKHQTTRAVEEDYLRRYPHSPFSAQIESRIAHRNKLTINFSYPELVVTSDSIHVDISLSANNDSCALLVYRLPEKLPENTEVIGIDKLKLVDRTVVHVTEKQKKMSKKNKSNYYALNAELAPLPLGCYVISAELFTAEGPYQQQPLSIRHLKQEMLVVSDLRTFDVSTPDSRRIYVVDGKDGSPVSGALVDINWVKKDKKGSCTLTTDEEGAVSCDAGASIHYSISKGADHPNDSYFLARQYKPINVVNSKVDIMTDLAIYRPGETVHFSAIAYEQRGSQRQVLKDSLYVVKLFDTQANLVDSLTAVSDDYGSFAGEFHLPTDGRNGSHRIVVCNKQGRLISNRNVEVSEYKLPNYYIDISDTKRAQKKGRRMKVEGRVLSYSGMPVANVPVEGVIDEDNCAGSYYRYDEDEYDFEVRTDADGRFSKRCRMHHRLFGWKGWVSYDVNVCATTEDGEELEASTTITKGKCKNLYLGNSDPFVLEENKEMALPIWASSDATTDGSWECSYSLYDKKGRRVKRGELSEGNTKVNWADLPTGSYRLKCKAKGGGRGFDQEIALVHSDANEMPVPITLWAPSKLQYVDEKGVAHLNLATSYETSVYFAAFNDGKEVAAGWLKCGPGFNKHEFQFEKSDDDVLFVSLYACHQGQQEYINTTITTPKKAPVSLRTVSFRDKITPGEREHWSFSLLDADNKPVEGRLMLELYSKAIEDLEPNIWRISSLSRSANPNHHRNMWIGKRDAYSFYVKPVVFEPCTIALPELNLWNLTYKNIRRGIAPGNKIRKSVNGYVVDKNGEPIIGAYIKEYGVEGGTSTDVDGYFSLDPILPGNVLEVSFVGYETKTAFPGSDMVVELEEDSQALAEVAVVGFGVSSHLYGARAMNKSLQETLDDMALGVQTVGENRKVLKTGSVALVQSEGEAALDNVKPRLGDVKVALWRPSIQSDSLGNFTIDFDVVNENTTWRLQALAYTSRLAYDMYSTVVLSQRPLMVQPSLPRFLRAGDSTTLRAAVENATDTLQQITAVIELFDVRSGQVLESSKQVVKVAAKSREMLTIDCVAPLHVETLGFRIKAVNARGDSDGEQQQIPILPAQSEVVQTQSFYLNPTQLEIAIKLPVADIDSTSRLMLEYCNNPTWYCMDALPVIAERDMVSSTGLAHCLYAQVVADNIGGADSVDYQTIIEKLKSLQTPDGGFVWIGNARNTEASNWATSTVVEVLGDLAQLHYLPGDSVLNQLLVSSLQYLDRDMAQRATKSPKSAAKLHFIDYVYLRTQFGDDYRYANDSIGQICEQVIQTTLQSLQANWTSLNLKNRAFAAMLLARRGHRESALSILESLQQMAVHDAGLGMYWDNLNRSSYYHPVAITSLMLRAFAEVGEHEYASCIEEMRQWLLLEKQTSHWGNYSMAAEAVHGLLYSGSDWLEKDAAADFQICIDGNAVDLKVKDENKGNVTVDVPATAHDISIVRHGQHPAWGALFHRHILPIEQIYADSVDEVLIRKELLVKDAEDSWKKLDEYGEPLKVGDNVRVRLVIVCNKDLDCLTLTDERPAFLEPQDYLSDYRWNWGSAGYYQEVKDTCMKLYFNRLNKGSHSFTYDCNVTQSGRFAAGVATIESSYAPQITAHSEGSVIEIK